MSHRCSPYGDVLIFRSCKRLTRRVRFERLHLTSLPRSEDPPLTSEPVLRLQPPPGQKTSPSTGEPPHVDSDAALAVLLRSGSRAAAAAVYVRFSAQVNRWVWRLLGADQEHNDIVQQVFVRILRSGRRLRDADKLAGWVHAITVNTVHGELRRRQVRRLFARDNAPEPLHGDFVREVEMRDLLVRAKSVIEKLPPGERIAFMLHYVDRHSAAEIAELCGFSVSTAKRRLVRATRRFEAIVAASPELYRSLPRLAGEES
jgi:RNA polymerase sigma-70 factor (ECF subfamily)